MKWLFWALLATVGWGLWGWFSGHAAGRGTVLGVTAAAVVVEALMFLPAYPQIARSGSWWVVGAGVAGAVAYGALFMALREPEAPPGAVIALTALYPILTAMLAWLADGQTLSWQQWAGVGLAGVSVVLISGGAG